MAKTNIIVILTDDLGYGDCSCYGQKNWTTPNIDRMASEGIRFTDFYTTSPVCSPARTSLLTGLHSGNLAIRSLADSFMPDHVPTIPALLKRQGYVSACIGKYGIGRAPGTDPLRKGFDYHYGYVLNGHAHNYFPPFLRENGLRRKLRNIPPASDPKQWETGVGVAEVKVDYSPDFIEERALDFIRSCAGRPFFLYYCPTLPHANNEGGQTPDGMEVDTYGEFEDRDWSPNEKGFARMVQRIDVTVGRILKTLDETGLARNTIVIFTSDNGPHNEGGHDVKRFDSAGGFQGYKRSLHEGGIRIPFIVRWPGVVSPGVSDFPGYFPDILPTCSEIAGGEIPGEIDGLSINPLLSGRPEEQESHQYLYFEYLEQTAVRKGRWKYYKHTGEKVEALYDLETDRREETDLSGSRPEILAELKECREREHVDYTPLEPPVDFDPPAGWQR